ncbi:SGNH/GDSL hydrolase family protein [Ruegeria arenilitoris]|uniref:SGNH/GDSL hydrolase family protein n=1 Tax=Ruegeria arenilitoris TaxID=1173585 RepID=UPI00147CCD85|nr:SGNH/GDSL hydrolase family protein [Ruegeria arenilitoris]
MSALLCIGDSHTRLIGSKPENSRFKYGRLCPAEVPGFRATHLLSIKGATAAGFRQKDHQNSPFAKATKAIKRLNPDFLVFGFGQVDAELSCYFVALRDSINLESALETRIAKLGSYLDACKDVADGRPFLIKGLNTSTLHETAALHRMVARNLHQELGLMQRQVVRALRLRKITTDVHRQLNTQLTTALSDAAQARNFPYVDLRETTGLKERPGLSKPSFCAGGTDIHLRLAPEVESGFAQAIANKAKELLGTRLS